MAKTEARERLDGLLQERITRKEFLTKLGLGLVSIMGIGAGVRLLFGTPRASTRRDNKPPDSGLSLYGGRRP